MEHQFYRYTPLDEDVLVLAGDIHTLHRHHEILDQVPSNLPVVLIAGNHEFYKSNFEDTLEKLRALPSRYLNCHFLHNTHTVISGVPFFGGTMYTDFKLNEPADEVHSKIEATKWINDFRRLIYIDDSKEPSGSRIWNVYDHIKGHEEFKAALTVWLKDTEGQKRVVVSHFTPSPQAIHPRWLRGDTYLNAYFNANMEKYMGWEGLWLYGHTHDSGDFAVGDTRCVGNPFGYGAENIHGFKPNLILEV